MDFSANQMKFFTAREVQSILQISDETLHKLRRAGKIEFIEISNRLYRYPADQPFFRSKTAIPISLEQITPKLNTSIHQTELVDKSPRKRRMKRRLQDLI